MRTIQTVVVCMVALAAYSADNGKLDATISNLTLTMDVDGVTPVSMTKDGKTIACRSYRMKKASEEEHEFTWQEVTTTRGGELAELLGDKLEDLDSLVVSGPINDADFRTLWSASLYGYLSAINLENAVI